MDIAVIGIGLISGAVVAASGYLKNKPKYDFEGFDTMSFAKTTIIGAVSGGVVGLTGLSPDVVTTLLTSMGITVIVENVLKALKNKFFN